MYRKVPLQVGDECRIMLKKRVRTATLLAMMGPEGPTSDINKAVVVTIECGTCARVTVPAEKLTFRNRLEYLTPDEVKAVQDGTAPSDGVWIA